MKAWLSGAIAAILVFVLLLLVFSAGTGAAELLMWLVVAVAVGGLVAFLLRKAEQAPQHR